MSSQGQSSVTTGKEKVWFITGISKGFGKELADVILHAGYRVIGTVRNTNNPAPIQHKNLHILKLDVSDENQVKDVIAQAYSIYGHIDVVVNNAGYGQAGTVEEVSITAAKKNYDTNVWGVVSVIQQIIPHMRKQGGGHIINISSFLAVVPLPGMTIYNSTKSALDGIAISLAVEVAKFNIYITNINLGLFRTEFLGGDSVVLPDNPLPELYGEYHGGAKALHGKQPYV
jgi:NAD(P)-dependent dehydrogenase (short-subunit alcohol dehydrogenase family)